MDDNIVNMAHFGMLQEHKDNAKEEQTVLTGKDEP